MGILESLKERRSFYALGKDLPVHEEQIAEAIKKAVALVPDAFNCRSARVSVLFGEKHEAFWDKVHEVFEGKLTKEKTDSFKAGAGTVLFFYDEEVIHSLQEKYFAYADRFPLWARDANGMLQISIWCALKDLGLGANLQHYNPVIDSIAKEFSGFPPSYCLTAQMPFGSIKAPARVKETEDIDKRVTIVS